VSVSPLPAVVKLLICPVPAHDAGPVSSAALTEEGDATAIPNDNTTAETNQTRR
jgi:hypothetical protein